jgi:pimeloyl-ACP methyl ester carboxylesterase
MTTTPRPSTEQFTLASGRKVCFAQYGDIRGAPVLFFQGTPSSRINHPPESITAELGVRLVIIDRPGFGGSEPAPGRTLVHWAEDVTEVLDHLGIHEFRATGVSGGGPYVLATAWRWPNRVLSASVCGGSGPLELPGALRGAAPVRKAGYLLARNLPWLFRLIIRCNTDPRRDAEKFVRSYTAHNPPADQAIIMDPTFWSMYLANFTEAYRQGPEAFADEVILGSRYWGFDLAEIRVPIHFWHGELDNSTPLGMSRGMAERIPRSRLTILPGQGHMFVYGRMWREVLGDLVGLEATAPHLD